MIVGVWFCFQEVLQLNFWGKLSWVFEINCDQKWKIGADSVEKWVYNCVAPGLRFLGLWTIFFNRFSSQPKLPVPKSFQLLVAPFIYEVYLFIRSFFEWLLSEILFKFSDFWWRIQEKLLYSMSLDVNFIRMIFVFQVFWLWILNLLWFFHHL